MKTKKSTSLRNFVTAIVLAVALLALAMVLFRKASGEMVDVL